MGLYPLKPFISTLIFPSTSFAEARKQAYEVHKAAEIKAGDIIRVFWTKGKHKDYIDYYIAVSLSGSDQLGD